jgi:hypothetical protein
MTLFSEWQQMSQTKIFVSELKQSIELIKEEVIEPSDKLTLEQIAVSTIERQAEARVLTRLIEQITEKEDERS